jgi:hypothetical protein
MQNTQPPIYLGQGMRINPLTGDLQGFRDKEDHWQIYFQQKILQVQTPSL